MTTREDLSFFEADSDTVREHVEETKSATAQYLVFKITGREMVVKLAHVSEIIPYEGLSAVPGTPPYVRGVVHVRGRVIPVVDLALKLGIQGEATAKRSSILMLEPQLAGQYLPLGIVIDGVATLLELEASHVKPAPRFGTSIDVRYLEGLVPIDNKTLPLIDFARMFAVDELTELASSTQAATSAPPLTK